MKTGTSKIRSVLWTVTLVTALATTAMAQPEGVLLRYQWEPGQLSRYTLVGRGHGEILIRGLPGERTPDELVLPLLLGFEAAYTAAVTDIDEAGTATLELRWEPITGTVDVSGKIIRTKIDFANQTITINDEEHPLTRAWPGRGEPKEGPAPEHTWPPVVKMTSRGKVLEIRGLDNFMRYARMAALRQLDPTRWASLSQAQFPEEPVLVGRQWTQSQLWPTPAGDAQPMIEGDATYTLQGLQMLDGRPCAVIALESSVNLGSMPQGEDATEPAPESPARVDEFSLAATSQGTIYFDYIAGEMVNAEITITVNSLTKVTVQRTPPDGEQQTFSFEQQMRDLVIETRLDLAE